MKTGKFCFANKIIRNANWSIYCCTISTIFAPYLIANRNTEKHTLHISLNPDPKDKVSDDRFRQMAEEYMQEMGYGEQPLWYSNIPISTAAIYTLYRFAWTSREKKISDKFEKMRSMNVCRELERQHGLIPATDKEHKAERQDFPSGRLSGRRCEKAKSLRLSATYRIIISFRLWANTMPCFPV